MRDQANSNRLRINADEPDQHVYETRKARAFVTTDRLHVMYVVNLLFRLHTCHKNTSLTQHAAFLNALTTQNYHKLKLPSEWK